MLDGSLSVKGFGHVTSVAVVSRKCSRLLVVQTEACSWQWHFAGHLKSEHDLLQLVNQNEFIHGHHKWCSNKQFDFESSVCNPVGLWHSLLDMVLIWSIVWKLFESKSPAIHGNHKWCSNDQFVFDSFVCYVPVGLWCSLLDRVCVWCIVWKLFESKSPSLSIALKAWLAPCLSMTKMAAHCLGFVCVHVPRIFVAMDVVDVAVVVVVEIWIGGFNRQEGPHCKFWPSTRLSVKWSRPLLCSGLHPKTKCQRKLWDSQRQWVEQCPLANSHGPKCVLYKERAHWQFVSVDLAFVAHGILIFPNVWPRVTASSFWLKILWLTQSCCQCWDQHWMTQHQRTILDKLWEMQCGCKHWERVLTLGAPHASITVISMSGST